MDEPGKLSVVLSIIVVIGLLSSLYGYNDYRSGGQLCNAVFEEGIIDCETVYSYGEVEVFGVSLHFSEIAPIYFISLTLFLSLYILLNKSYYLYILKLLFILGLVAIPYLVYIELFEANAICIFCTIMHASIILGSIILYKYY
ncbi:MAG: hypothetical protein F7C81_01775 [Desulfurococcales archaeon]|nr:hypothetical protein [Desulfurococcales archaeon]